MLSYTVVDCGVPHVPKGTIGGLSVNYNETIINSTATYSCNIGYNLIGEKTTICGVNGTWNGAVPHCESKKREVFLKLI